MKLTVARGTNLSIGFIAVMIGMLLYIEIKDFHKYRMDVDLRNRYIIGNTLIESAIDLSLERSVTQVLNALVGPVTPEFEALLMEERKQNKTKISQVIKDVRAMDDAVLNESFLKPLFRYLEEIGELRKKADVSIKQFREDRDSDFVTEWPEAVPRIVSEIVGLRRVLLATDGSMPTVTAKLDTMALEAWRIREQAGRARTLIAIALANNVPISGEAERFIRLRENDVHIAEETIRLIASSSEMPPALKEALANYDKIFEVDYLKLKNSIMEASAEGKPYPVSFDEYFKQSAIALETVEKLSEVARAEGMVTYTDAMNASLNQIIFVAILLSISIGFAIWTSYYLRFNVARRLQTMVGEVDKLANSDFSANPHKLRGSDEVGRVANALEQLKQLAIKRVESDRAQLDMAKDAEAKAQHILVTTREISSAASSTAAVIEGVASAAAEMNASINNLAQNAQTISSLTKRASGQAKASAEANQKLKESTDRIREMVEMIRGIAEQTNLLSLNAAIEAARAGDSGRGFAVVADEVKKLAALAEQRSNEIQSHIHEIAQSSQSSIQMTDGLVTAFSEIGEMIEAMSESMSEQQKATNDITSNIQHAAASTQQVSSSIESLQKA